jgi:hypothetical protein
MITRLGTKRFGVPSQAAQESLAAIVDYDRLDRISDRILEATDWNDLLASP